MTSVIITPRGQVQKFLETVKALSNAARDLRETSDLVYDDLENMVKILEEHEIPPHVVSALTEIQVKLPKGKILRNLDELCEDLDHEAGYIDTQLPFLEEAWEELRKLQSPKHPK